MQHRNFSYVHFQCIETNREKISRTFFRNNMSKISTKNEKGLIYSKTIKTFGDTTSEDNFEFVLYKSTKS